MSFFLDKYRKEVGLTALTEDTLEVSKHMRASSPPPTTAGNDDNLNQKRSRPFRRVRTNIVSEVVTLSFIVCLFPSLFH